MGSLNMSPELGGHHLLATKSSSKCGAKTGLK